MSGHARPAEHLDWDDTKGRAVFGAHWNEHLLTPDCPCGGDEGVEEYLAALDQRAFDEAAKRAFAADWWRNPDHD